MFYFYNIDDIGNLCPSKRQIAAMEDWVKDKCERKKRRFAQFKERVEQYWKLYPWLMCAAFCLSSCRSQQIFVPNDTITQTNTKTKTIVRDSVYHYDKDSMAITMRSGEVSWRSGAHVGSDPACYPYGRTIGGQTLMSYPARIDTLVIEKWHEHWKDRWLTRTDTLIKKDTTVITQTITQTQIKEVKHVPAFYKWCTGLFFLILLFVIGWLIHKIRDIW